MGFNHYNLLLFKRLTFLRRTTSELSIHTPNMSKATSKKSVILGKKGGDFQFFAQIIFTGGFQCIGIITYNLEVYLNYVNLLFLLCLSIIYYILVGLIMKRLGRFYPHPLTNSTIVLTLILLGDRFWSFKLKKH